MKKSYFLVCLSVVFLLGCTADGPLPGGDPGNPFSPDKPNSPIHGIPSNPSNNPNNPSTGSCVGSGCDIGVYLYCAAEELCVLIGNYVSKNECLNVPSSVFATREYCLSWGYDIYE
jgi:hypothetical protein